MSERVRLWSSFTLAAILAAPGCSVAANEPDEAPVAKAAGELVRRDNRWPVSRLDYWTDIPVCWEAGTETAFPQLTKTIRRLANSSWPTIAAVNFTGWGTCSGTTPKIVLRISTTLSSQSNGLGYPASGDRILTFKSTDAQITAGLVPHLFGLALGFAQENSRTGWTGPPACGITHGTGGDAFTPPDPTSVMATTGLDATFNCKYGSATPSNWDAQAIQRVYKRRVVSFTPLATWWNGSTHHTTVADSAGPSSPTGSPVYFQGWTWVNNSIMPGTVELRTYKNPGGTAVATVAAGSLTEQEVADGFKWVLIDGPFIASIYPTQQPGTVPLFQYRHSVRGDYLATILGPGSLAAVQAGYDYQRIEGYVFENLPYKMLGGWWHSGREDNIVTAVDSQLAADADNAGYAYYGFDVPIMRYGVDGTRPLGNYWLGSTADHFLVGSSTARAASLGYTQINTEGYAFTSYASLRPSLNSFFSSSRGDHFTVGRPEFQGFASSPLYTSIATEGYGLAQWTGW